MVDIDFDLEIEGQISERELNIRLKILAELIINKIKENIKDMDLIGETADFLQGWISEVRNGTIIIENRTEYSTYLEYGTYAYWEQNKLDKYTDPMQPKKKDLSYSKRKDYPKGMQSFAPVRKVIFNEKIMSQLVQEAFS